MKAWASSGRGRGVCVCHLSAPFEPRNRVLGFVFGARCVAVALDIFRGTSNSNSSSYLLHGLFFFQTEGKQMRRNVNSRLLMQHCAKICAPAAWNGPSVKAGLPLHPARRTAFRETNRGAGSFLFGTADRETHRVAHTHLWSTLPLPFSSQT